MLEFSSLFSQLKDANNKVYNNLEKAFQQFPIANQVLECKQKLTDFYETNLSTLRAIQQTAFVEEISTKEPNIEEEQEEQEAEIPASIDATILDYVDAVEQSYVLEKHDDFLGVEKVGTEDKDKDETFDDVIKAAEKSIDMEEQDDDVPLKHFLTEKVVQKKQNQGNEKLPSHQDLEIATIAAHDDITDQELEAAMQNVENVIKTPIGSQPNWSLGIRFSSEVVSAVADKTTLNDDASSKTPVKFKEHALIDSEVEALKERVEEELKKKRTIKPGGQICSPYMNRRVNLKDSISTIEKKVSEWIFGMQEDQW